MARLEKGLEMILRSVAFLISAVLVAGPAFAGQTSEAAPQRGCPRDSETAMWYSIAHPGVGEWYLNGWGSMARNAPQKKFWLGFIPGFGWPGYLQVKSAIDARNCRTNDELW